MDTYIAYFDETGDDGTAAGCSDYFVLTSLYMNIDAWKRNSEMLHACRKTLKNTFGLPTSEEIHTRHLLLNKEPYRSYNWTQGQRQDIVRALIECIADLQAKIVNVIIDKTKLRDKDYPVLENALKYSIQRIENDSQGQWHYLIITDRGRVAPMRRTARAIQVHNPIPSMYKACRNDRPVLGMIEDILDKDSKESGFIQMCDFVSYFVHLYYKAIVKGEDIPKRIKKVINKAFVERVMITLKDRGVLNTDAARNDKFGLVVCPK